MNVFTRVVWRVELDDPVDLRDVETAGGNVGAAEDAVVGVAEFEKGVGSFLLLLFALWV